MRPSDTQQISHPLPSHRTKHLKHLHYNLWPPVHRPSYNSGQSPSVQVLLLQNDTCGLSTGSTLWLGAQLLSAYLLSHAPSRTTRRSQRRYAIEIGAGTGLMSITLSALGYSVLATDIEPSLTSILMPNVKGWVSSSSTWSGPLCVCRLDWNLPINHRSIQSCLSSLCHPGDLQDAFINLNQVDDEKCEDTELENKKEFDLIVTTDTVYTSELLRPLLMTLKHLSDSSTRPPPIYLALERRDPTLVENFFNMAEELDFKADRIDRNSLVKVTEQMGWELDDWEGVEIWKLRQRVQKSKPRHISGITSN
ncbi:hypothetical protein DFH28DRAFT_957629 [Melampsora americana]|nr:hypothetical protein DFH28DRAFT_957629 [Melampsora americana]